MSKLINYLKVTIEGNDGQASIKRILGFISFAVAIGICITYSKSHTEFIITNLLTFTLVILGITVWQNVSESKNKKDGE